jgi:hypothetical protein
MAPSSVKSGIGNAGVSGAANRVATRSRRIRHRKLSPEE